MPKRNIVKIYGADNYYHVYNRGNNHQEIFKDKHDYSYFMSLLKRYLSSEKSLDKSGRENNNYADEVELVAFCLMPNHFHLLCYLKEPDGIVHLMRSVMTAYTMYFNKKYQRSGKLCESTFLASRISNDGYLWHITRYIHLNPMDLGIDYENYDYSSLSYFAGKRRSDWLHDDKLLETRQERVEYLDFVKDYETMHKDVKYLKNLLASL